MGEREGGRSSSEEDMRRVEEDIRRVEEDMRRVEADIRRVVAKIESAESATSKSSDPEKTRRLEKELKYLRQEKVGLRQKEHDLRQKEIGQSQGWSQGTSKVWRDLGEFLAESKAKRESKKSISISGVSQSIWIDVQGNSGLRLLHSQVVFKPKRESNLPAFDWDGRLEKAQADRYMPHIDNIARGQKWKVIDAANTEPGLLSGSFGGWNFRGTTDVAFIDSGAWDLPQIGLRCIFELKKDMVLRNRGQFHILIRLALANIFSEPYRPFAILTDLVDSWVLYWMDGSTIFHKAFESRAIAVGCIEDFLQDHEDMDTSGSLPYFASPGLSAAEDTQLSSVFKRRKFSLPEMENLSDLVGFLPDEEIQCARAEIAIQRLLEIPALSSMFSNVPDPAVDG